MEVMSVTGAIVLVLAVIVALFAYDYAGKKGWIGAGGL